MFKLSMVLVSVLALAACGSSGDMEDSAADDMARNAASTSGANTSPVINQQPTAEERARDRALRNTVFYFDFDVAEFRPIDRETLTHHARDLAANPNKRVRLEGHADERGTREYNLALGERRSNGILDFLIVNGASRSQLETVSYGEERPSRRGTTEEAYQANRRVEIVAQ
ncbi:MAG: OmpA family protein [Pseudohongiellaceae bacterium]